MLFDSKLRHRETLRLPLVAMTANLALLASLGPVTGFFSLCTESYAFMVVLSVTFFAVSGFVGLAFPRRALNSVYETIEPPPADPVPPQIPPPATEEGGRSPTVPVRSATPPRPRPKPSRPASFRALGKLLIAEIDGLLRAEGRHAVERGRVPIEHLAALLVFGGFCYGAAMGSFGLRPLQASYSGIEVPILLAFSTLVRLPSFYVLNALLGLRDDSAAALRGVLAAQATVAIALLSMLPMIVLTYVSTGSYRYAAFQNGVFFALATLAGQRTMNRHYRPLVLANRPHEVGRWYWIVLYTFVAIPLARVLRPFIGWPDLAVSFFGEEAWINAYVAVLHDVLGL